MEHTNGSGNGGASSRSVEKARRSPTTPRQDAGTIAIREPTVAGYAIVARSRTLEAAFEQHNSDHAVFLKNHVDQVRAATAAALDVAIQAERRRLASALYDGLVERLCAARVRLSVAIETNTDAAIGEALHGIDACLSAAVKATRGMVSNLAPISYKMRRVRFLDRFEPDRRVITAGAVKMAEAAGSAATP
jgi:signal transduction histidine kinase